MGHDGECALLSAIRVLSLESTGPVLRDHRNSTFRMFLGLLKIEPSCVLIVNMFELDLNLQVPCKLLYPFYLNWQVNIVVAVSKL